MKAKKYELSPQEVMDVCKKINDHLDVLSRCNVSTGLSKINNEVFGRNDFPVRLPSTMGGFRVVIDNKNIFNIAVEHPKNKRDQGFVFISLEINELNEKIEFFYGDNFFKTPKQVGHVLHALYAIKDLEENAASVWEKLKIRENNKEREEMEKVLKKFLEYL